MPPPSPESGSQTLSQDIVYSDARSSDYERIAQLHAISWQSAYRGIVSQEYLDHHAIEDRLSVWKKGIGWGISEGQFGILASRGEDLLGVVWVRLDADPQWGCAVDNLHVHPDAKGLGIGRRLMSMAAELVMRHRPGAPLFLFVLAANHGAVGFYDRQGGLCEERVMRRTGDGNSIPALRYVWKNPDVLIAPRENSPGL